ncbi:MAG: hypothetical protein ACYC10_18865 [Allorhizobium sp.]
MADLDAVFARAQAAPNLTIRYVMLLRPSTTLFRYNRPENSEPRYAGQFSSNETAPVAYSETNFGADKKRFVNAIEFLLLTMWIIGQRFSVIVAVAIAMALAVLFASPGVNASSHFPAKTQSYGIQRHAVLGVDCADAEHTHPRGYFSERIPGHKHNSPDHSHEKWGEQSATGGVLSIRSTEWVPEGAEADAPMLLISGIDRPPRR